MIDPFSSVWGHSMHFAKFPMLGFPKGYWSHNFNPIATKLHEKYVNQGKIQPVA